MINSKITAWDSPILRIETKQEESLPLFKGEKEPAELKINSDFSRTVSQQVFSAYADYLGKSVAGDIPVESKMTATIFPAIAKVVGKEPREVQSEIKAYAEANRMKVLANIRQLTQEAGLSLGAIKADEFIRLIGSSHPENLGKKGISKYLGSKKAITPKHLANCAVAQIIADLYKINVTLRDMMINYDRMFTSGSAYETIRYEVTSEGNNRSLELVQGWGIFTNGIFASKPKFLFEHFPPVMLVSAEEKK